MEWKPIETAPKDGTPIRVKLSDQGNTHEYYSFFNDYFCTGNCSTAADRKAYYLEYGQKAPEHIRHLHEDWVICDGWGEELHPLEGYRRIYPTHWKPMEIQP
jgi:hypothetical protein